MRTIIVRHTAPVASLSDLSFRNRAFMAVYPYRALDPVPFTRPRVPLEKARVALVTTGGVHLPSQEPFDDEAKGGDSSFREIPSDTNVETIGIAHKSDAFDQTGFREDRNLGFPLARLREMAARGEDVSKHFAGKWEMRPGVARGDQQVPPAVACQGVDVEVVVCIRHEAWQFGVGL